MGHNVTLVWNVPVSKTVRNICYLSNTESVALYNGHPSRVYEIIFQLFSFLAIHWKIDFNLANNFWGIYLISLIFSCFQFHLVSQNAPLFHCHLSVAAVYLIIFPKNISVKQVPQKHISSPGSNGMVGKREGWHLKSLRACSSSLRVWEFMNTCPNSYFL